MPPLVSYCKVHRLAFELQNLFYMCVNRRWIRNYYGRPIFVSCGHCPACLQEKAINRTNRIRFNQSYDGSRITLFVTLTYRNACIPYFRLSEFNRYCSDDFGNINLNIYRDTYDRWVVDPNNDHARYRKSYDNTVVLTTTSIPDYYTYHKFRKLEGQGDDKIGVIYYKDFQDFIKRLRARFDYINYEKSFSYYSCAEYGPTTCRPHFHCLFTIPTGDFSLWSDAISQAWSFDDYNRTRNHIEVARNAAAYAASYVNSAAIVPPLFKEFAFKQKNSYSKGYGCSPECFSLDKILQAFERRDLRFSISRVRDHALVVDDMLLPKYVISRRFPKFKGMCRLTTNEIEQLCLRPYKLREYAYRLEYTDEQLSDTVVMIQNKMFEAQKMGVNIFDYARCWSQIWSVRASNVMRLFYSEIKLMSDNFVAYDNIKDFYEGYVPSPSLMSVSKYIPKNPWLNANEFPRNVLRHQNLVRSYESYSKDRKIRSYILASEDFNI